MSEMPRRHDLIRYPGGGAAGHASPEANEYVRPDGELVPAELLFRIGILLGAAVFLAGGQGTPWSRGPVVMAAGLLMAALVVMTLTFQWRVLGDWRRRSQQAVLAVLVLVLAVPLCAVIWPRLGSSALPESIELALMELQSGISRVPGLSAALEIVRGLIVFIFYALVLVVLIATSGAARRAGFLIISLATVAAALFFYPTPETVVGLIFLGLFFHVQWERPLLVPDRLRPKLSAIQVSYLRDLLKDGAMSTGETKIFLEHDAEAFRELLEFNLVEYDTFTREVLPGVRLLHDPTCETLETILGYARRAVWILLGLVYLLMPDIIPGPFDDAIILAMCSGAGFNWFTTLFGRGRAGRRGR